MTTNPTPRSRVRRRPPRRGAALLLCLFIVFMISSLVLNVLDTETLQLSAVRNIEDYERALYLADAGVQHANAELKNDNTVRGTFDVGAYPADGTYQYTISDGAVAEQVAVMARGASGNVVRSIDATLLP